MELEVRRRESSYCRYLRKLRRAVNDLHVLQYIKEYILYNRDKPFFTTQIRIFLAYNKDGNKGIIRKKNKRKIEQESDQLLDHWIT